MVKYFGREIFPADLTFSKKEVLLKKFYLLVITCPGDGSAMWSYSGTRPLLPPTPFWPIQKFSQSFSYLKSPLINNTATLLILARFFCQLMTSLTGF